MGILDKIKLGIDTPMFRQMKPMDTANAAGGFLCCDKRNGICADNSIYQLASSTLLNRYSEWYNGSMSMGSPALTVFGTGTEMRFTSSFGIYGILAGGCSTSKLISSTALTNGIAITSLGVNQLRRTDMEESYRIRVIGYASGLTEYRLILANTTGTTPTYYLETPLSFTPSAGDRYEIQSGVIYIISPTTAASTQTKYYGVAQGVYGSAGSTGITLGAASAMTALDEQYVPYDSLPGEGMILGTGTYNAGNLKCLVATNTSSGTLTGQSVGGDNGVTANAYRNFVIRIVEDTSIPTANGQRRVISSHTGGLATTPVYTLGTAWTVTPSITAKYVIECPNLLLLQNITQSGMLTYNYTDMTINNGTSSIAPFTWSSTYFNATHGSVIASSAISLSSIHHRPARNADGVELSKHGYVYFFRGSSSTLDRFDISGAINGLWANAITYNNPVTLGVGSCGDIDGTTFEGEYAYIVSGGTATMYQFSIANPSLVPWVKLPLQSGTAVSGNRVCCLAHIPSTAVDQNDKLGMIYVQSHLSTNLYRSDIIG